jgi:hypothetical protein
MRSAVIPSARSYPAVRLAPQPVHQRCVLPGPLVLGKAPRKSQTPTADRDRTVSRRSKPSSRTALNGEQPYPWDLLQPQDAMSRHRGAKRRRRYGLLGVISLLSPAYLLSVERWPFHAGPPDHYGRLSSLLELSLSQSGLCHCTHGLISDQPEPTIARLRYSLGGDRPSQTTRHAGSRTRVHGPRLDVRDRKGGISRMPPPQLAPGLHRLPPILHIRSLTPLQSCSKGARGLSV